MPSTVDLVIEKFQGHFPDCPTDRAQALFADAHREVLLRTRLRQSTLLLNLSEGVGFYDLPSEGLLVLAAEYRASASDATPLAETSVDHLDMRAPGWRSTPRPGSPREYFTVGSPDGDSAKTRIGLDPTPDRDTVGGYPVVALHVILDAAITGSEAVPPQLLSDAVYVAHMAAAWCLERNREQ